MDPKILTIHFCISFRPSPPVTHLITSLGLIFCSSFGSGWSLPSLCRSSNPWSALGLFASAYESLSASESLLFKSWTPSGRTLVTPVFSCSDSFFLFLDVGSVPSSAFLSVLAAVPLENFIFIFRGFEDITGVTRDTLSPEEGRGTHFPKAVSSIYRFLLPGQSGTACLLIRSECQSTYAVAMWKIRLAVAIQNLASAPQYPSLFGPSSFCHLLSSTSQCFRSPKVAQVSTSRILHPINSWRASGGMRRI